MEPRFKTHTPRFYSLTWQQWVGLTFLKWLCLTKRRVPFEVCPTRGCAYCKSWKKVCVPTMNSLNTGRIHASPGLNIPSLKNFHKVWVVFIISINSQFQIHLPILACQVPTKRLFCISQAIISFHRSLRSHSLIRSWKYWYPNLVCNQSYCLSPWFYSG